MVSECWCTPPQFMIHAKLKCFTGTNIKVSPRASSSCTRIFQQQNHQLGTQNHIQIEAIPKNVSYGIFSILPPLHRQLWATTGRQPKGAPRFRQLCVCLAFPRVILLWLCTLLSLICWVTWPRPPMARCTKLYTITINKDFSMRLLKRRGSEIFVYLDSSRRLCFYFDCV